MPANGRWVFNSVFKGLTLTRLTNKIFLHNSTECVRPSETFRTSCQVVSIEIYRETTSTEHTVSVWYLIFCRRIFSEKNSQVSIRIWWSVRRSWIPTNPSLPCFWRTKKSSRRKPTGFWFSDLFYFLFLSCLNKLRVRWTRYFLCCSTTSIWLLVQAWYRAYIWCTESPSRSERRKISRTEWWMIAGLHQSRMVHRSSYCVLWGYRKIVCSEDVLVKGKRPVVQKPLPAISPVAAGLYAFPNISPIW